MRLRQLRAQLRQAIVEHDILGLAGGAAQYLPAYIRLRSLEEWLTRRADELLGGNWSASYAKAAWQHGHAKAMSETRSDAAPQAPNTAEHLAQLARQEFDGIAAALVQQVMRAAVDATSRHLNQHLAYTAMVKPFDKMATHRVRANVNVIVVKAHNEAKLMAYRNAGIGYVGVIPETTRRRPARRQVRDWNPDQPREPAGSPEGGQWTSGGGGGGELSAPPPSAGGKTYRVVVARKGINAQMNRDTEVLVNPSKATLFRFLRETGGVRTMVDKDDNVYAWRSSDATHEGLAGSLGFKVKEWGNELFLSESGKPISKDWYEGVRSMRGHSGSEMPPWIEALPEHDELSAPPIPVLGSASIRLGDKPLPSRAITVTLHSQPMRSPHVEVLVNPNKQDVLSMGRETEEGGVRTLNDVHGNMFVWKAEEAIHSQVLVALQNSGVNFGNTRAITGGTLWYVAGRAGIHPVFAEQLSKAREVARSAREQTQPPEEALATPPSGPIAYAGRREGDRHADGRPISDQRFNPQMLVSNRRWSDVPAVRSILDDRGSHLVRRWVTLDQNGQPKWVLRTDGAGRIRHLDYWQRDYVLNRNVPRSNYKADPFEEIVSLNEPLATPPPSRPQRPVTLYHGTVARHLKGIMKHGLVPGRGGGAERWVSQVAGRKALREMRALGGPRVGVYATRSRAEAELFASAAAGAMQVGAKGSELVVLRLRVPRDQFDKRFRPDKRNEGSRSSVVTNKPIPPEWIVGLVGPRPDDPEKYFDAVAADDVDVYLVLLIPYDDDAEADLTLDWNPDQPRVPAGSPDGGQWTSGAGGGGEGEGEGDDPRRINVAAQARATARLEGHIQPPHHYPTGTYAGMPIFAHGRGETEAGLLATSPPAAMAAVGVSSAEQHRHPGHGYSREARVDDNGVIHTSNVYDAVRALYEQRQVELNQPHQVSVLVDKLGEVASRMISKGKDAPTFDLCKVTIRGTNLFCADATGLPRVVMPQLKGVPEKGSIADRMRKDERGEVDISNDFREYLKTKNYKMFVGRERAANLRPTQGELNGAKVAVLGRAAHRGRLVQQSLFISRDNYIVDGHHRWAAMIAVDFEDNKIGNVTVPVVAVDAGIITLLAEARNFSKRMGIPQASIKSFVEEKKQRGPVDLTAPPPPEEQPSFGFGRNLAPGFELRQRVLREALENVTTSGRTDPLRMGMEKVRAAFRIGGPPEAPGQPGASVLNHILTPTEWDALEEKHGSIGEVWDIVEGEWEDRQREEEEAREEEYEVDEGDDIEPIGWTRGDQDDMSADMRDRLLPATKLIVTTKDRHGDEYKAGTVFVGERGDWHAEIMANEDFPHAMSTEGMRANRMGRAESGTPNYQRGFVDPLTKKYYSAFDVAIDAAELLPVRSEAEMVMREMHESGAPPPIRSRDALTLFDKPPVSTASGRAYYGGRSGPGSRSSREETPGAWTIARIEAAQEELEEAVGNEVDVLTAGDEFVCDDCQEIADGGPYTLAEAQGMIPAHVNCRCTFVPASDNRYASDAAIGYNPEMT